MTIVDAARRQGLRPAADRSQRATRSWPRRPACSPRARRSSASSRTSGPDGEVMLGAFVFPRPFDWAILVEKRQRDAYLAVEKMLQSLGLWSLIGARRRGCRRDPAGAPDQPPDRQDRARRPGGRAGQFRGPGPGRALARRGRRSRPAHERDGGRAERALPARQVRLGRHHGGDQGRRSTRASGWAASASARPCCSATSAATPRSPSGTTPRRWSRCSTSTSSTRPTSSATHHGDVDKFVGDQIVAVFQGEEMERNAVALRARDPGRDRRARPRPSGLGPRGRHRDQHRRGDRRRDGQQGPDGLHGPRRRR